MDTSRASRHPLAIAGVAAGIITIVAAFLPWASALDGALTTNGTDGDGRITIFFAILGIIGVAAARGRRWGLVSQLVAAIIVALIGVANVLDISGDDAAGLLGIDVGSGLWLTTLVGIAWTVVAILTLVRRREIWGEPAPAAAGDDVPPPPAG